MSSNFMQHENFISNKENLNGFDDTMEEPMDIDPSTPFANKIRPVAMRQPHQETTEQGQDTENTHINETQLKEQQQQGPKIVKPVNGPKIVKPIRPQAVVPKVIRPNGLPLPQINNKNINDNDDDFLDVDPFKTRTKIGFDTSEFQSPGGFNLRLSDETMNETKNFDQEQDPFRTKSSIMNSPVRSTPPKSSSSLFKSPPPPPMFSGDDMTQNNDDLSSNSTELSQQNGDLNSLNDEWETHQKRRSSSSNRSLNNSLNKQGSKSPPAKQTISAVSSNVDFSSSDNITSSPPLPNKNHRLGLSTSPSESNSEANSIYSLNTASSSSMGNNNYVNEEDSTVKLDCSKNHLDSSRSAWTGQVAQEVKTPVVEEAQAIQEPAEEFAVKQVESQQEIDDEFMQSLKQNKFIGGSRGESAPVVVTNQLVDFGDNNMDFNTNSEANVNENDKACQNVVFDSIFSNDQDFDLFLDLLEKKQVNETIKQSPKYSEFARKSLYIQFDPITQLNLASSLSPEKVKRLSLIVDKQKAIKSYLTDIAKDTITEDETEAESTFSSNATLTKPVLTEDLPAIEEIQPFVEKFSTTEILVEETIEILPQQQSDMIIMNSNNDNNVALADKSADNFSRKLVLTDDDEVADREDTTVNKNTSLNDHEVEFEATEETNLEETEQQPLQHATLSEKRLSVDKNSANQSNNSGIDLDRSTFKTPNTDTSFKLINEESMMLDESTLMPVKADNFNNKTNSKQPSAKHSSSEDLSSSSVCMSSASTQEMAKLVSEINELKERERAHLLRIDSLEEENEKFKTVAIDFEEIFKNLIMDKEENEVKLKNEIIELTKERDQLQEDVIGVERAFDDLHRRFEKLKTKVEEFKKNEESLQEAIEVYKQQLDKEKSKYSTLKRHAEEKIEFANSEIDKLRKSSAVELQRLSAELRKAEIKISSLDLSVQQKDQENSQLTNLLEDLLQKVKPSDS